MDKFETWWEREGQEFLYALNTTTDDDIKLVAEIAWKNGAYCTEQSEQEPVAWFRYESTYEYQNKLSRCTKGCFGAFPVYAAPVRAKDLTDDEVIEICKDPATSPCKPWWLRDDVVFQDIRDAAMRFARAVIAKDREKNK